MDTEISVLEMNNTWDIVDLPVGKTAMGSKWIYRIKYHSNGTVERHKARLVAKGYTQPEGLDYHETFSPVAKLVTYAKFSSSLINFGLTQSRADYSLFTKGIGNSFIALFVYVDDIDVASNDLQEVSAIKSFLDTRFKVKDLGSLKYFLGLEVARNSTRIQVCQRKYALDILHDSGLLACKPSLIPMDPNLKLSKDEGKLRHDPAEYRRLVGKLLYLTITRPDLSYSVNLLNQYMATPRVPHLQAAYKVLRCGKKSPSQGLFFAASSSYQITAYCDSDWASCPDTRRSTIGYCVFLGKSLIS
ncbi:hypothetical protein F2P56_001944 [Juglans regia]|uniref:Reverse transcriptase Ty1/copia-type domain-containing protein n=1 Tax=Juglans regia TaxID=51240 RepID=A0A833Y086_JUGRE|nr:hypothetical protein F2P56_001944 [Juglans regia]